MRIKADAEPHQNADFRRRRLHTVLHVVLSPRNNPSLFAVIEDAASSALVEREPFKNA